jgi:hypothetical protein
MNKSINKLNTRKACVDVVRGKACECVEVLLEALVIVTIGQKIETRYNSKKLQKIYKFGWFIMDMGNELVG